MAYRRTERVIARLAARQEAIVAAARALASESGMAAVQIVPVAERAGIAAGTVYSYFPSKDDLVAALVGDGGPMPKEGLRRPYCDLFIENVKRRKASTCGFSHLQLSAWAMTASGQKETKNHVRCHGSFRRKQPWRPHQRSGSLRHT
jgi:hypothetical protein